MKPMIFSTISVPLETDFYAIARQFAMQQITPQRGKQVYLNTLAVCAVYKYLNEQKIRTVLEDGDSWDTAKRLTLDTADLVIPEVGRIECRPVLPEQEFFSIPYEVAQDRDGYLPVQFNNSLEVVELLGFVSTVEVLDFAKYAGLVSPSEPELMDDLLFPISELKPLNTLLDHLAIPSTALPNFTSLKDWYSRFIEQRIAAGWGLFTFSKGTLRPAAAGAAIIQEERWVREIPSIPARWEGSASLIESEQLVEIQIKLIPTENHAYLPANLRASLIAEDGQSWDQVCSGERESTIVLERYIAKPGSKFTIQAELAEFSTEETLDI